MNKLSKILVISVILIISFLGINKITNGADMSASPMYLGIFENGNGRKTGFYDYYEATNSSGGRQRRPVIKVVQYANQAGTGAVDYATQLYCIRHGVGFGSAGSTGAIVPYTQKFDLLKPNEIPAEYKTAIGISGEETNNFKSLVWIANNVANPNDSESVNKLFNTLGINLEEFKGDKTKMTNEQFVDVLESAQQLAMWYFTNPSGQPFNPGEIESLRVGTNNTDASKTSVASKYYNDLFDYPLQSLYSALISNAKRAVAGGYNVTNANGSLTFEKQFAKGVTVGGYHKFGPYKFTYTGNIVPNVEVFVNSNVVQNPRVINEAGTEITGTSLWDKISKINGQNFYVTIPESQQLDSLMISYSYSHKNKNIEYWSTSANIAQSNQPVILIKDETITGKEQITTVLQKQPKNFDLALRKFITKVIKPDGRIIEHNRVPVISDLERQKFNNKTGEFGTTIVKTHTKTPVHVEKNDRVIYKIRVYNEGNVDGRVELLDDTLPEGLELVTDSEINRKYAWGTMGSSKELSTKYLENTLLKAYNPAQDISYADVEVECRVIADYGSSPKSLINIAEIASSVSSEGQRNDIDSTGRNVIKNNYNVSTSERGKGYEDDDDYEPLVLNPKTFDLALRKFITKVNDKNITDRVPVVDTSKLDVSSTTAEYRHKKEPIKVKIGDIITYTLRIYNEGQVEGWADEIIDHLPEELEYVDTELNRENGWTRVNDRTYKTLKLSKNNKAKSILPRANENLNYVDVQIQTRVKANTQKSKILTNIAEIGERQNEFGILDRDNRNGVNLVTLPADQNLPSYRGNASNKEVLNDSTYHYKGQEDDDDFEKVVVEDFDLALRKFITRINQNDITNRIPNPDITNLANGTSTTAEYKHTKNPLLIQKTDLITYTLRVYNEASLPGFAEEITDYLPPELEYIDNEFNRGFGWTKDSSDSTGRTIKTTHLSRAKSSSNEIAGFNGNRLDYREVQVQVRVKPNAVVNDYLTNIAEISQYYNKENIKDRDNENKIVRPNDNELPRYKGNKSNKDDLGDSNYHYKGQEDDDDFEKVMINGFDLALRKFITGINDTTIKDREPVVDVTPLVNGSSTTAEYKHPKAPVAIAQSDIITYTLRVYNEGNIDGYADEIVDYLPAELEYIDNAFNKSYNWKIDSDNRTIRTNYLSKATNVDNVISKFDGKTLRYKEVKIQARIKSGINVQHILTNIAEITITNNEKNLKDRDNDNKVVRPKDKDLPNYKGNNNNKNDLNDSNYHYKGQEDDDDFEKVVVKSFDLSLRKFISAINSKDITDREPVVDVTPLVNGSSTTAEYKHPKAPIKINSKDVITYTLRVYNEGSIDGYAEEITDYLPPELEYIDNEFNRGYEWNVDSTGRIIKTKFLSKNKNVNNVITKFDGSTLSYKEVKIQAKVKNGTKVSYALTNIAEISEYFNESNLKDRDNDNKVVRPNDNELPGYKGNKSNKDDLGDKNYHYKGQEDDDDFEKVIFQEFDLSLRKFITNINGTENKDRIPEVDVTKLANETSTTAEYKHPKDPIKVNTNDIVTYTIRVYNEGSTSGYAAEIKDDLPKGLVYLPEHSTNIEYKWKLLDKDGLPTTDLDKAVSVVTDYLSKKYDTATKSNLLKGFDNSKGELDYRDVKITFKVIEPNTSDRIIINKAQISEDTDEDGNTVEDMDSKPNKWNDGEDDQDEERLYVKYFDLSLRKWVTTVILIEDGKTKESPTGHKAEDDPEKVVKVEVNKKRLKDTIIKFKYSIKVKNEGEIAGYAKEISDYIPDGLKFVASENPKWKEVNGKIVTDQLKDTLLKPGEEATVEIVLTWINGENNMKTMVNTAEISDDENEHGTPDKDSTPNNRRREEDDEDDAPVSVTTVSGAERTYITISLVVLVLVGTGIVLMKKNLK